VHDCSDGGLALALAEMAMAGKLGAVITTLPPGPAHGALFGEDQARYVITCAPSKAAAVQSAAKKAGAPFTIIGTVGGDALTLGEEQPISVDELSRAHESWFPAFMAGKA
jgi:phosphoribosylformylglycinamidine synthase subunit PurL